MPPADRGFLYLISFIINIDMENLVKLIACTQAINPTTGSIITPIESVAYIARVSTNKLDKTANFQSLFEHLITNEHWSPLEHYYYTFEIDTTRATGRQLLRHRSFTFQEFSQRYSKDVKSSDYELRLKDKNSTNRQGGGKEEVAYTFERQSQVKLDILTDEQQLFYQEFNQHIQASYDLYQEAIMRGISQETARFILPEVTHTLINCTMNLRQLIHFIHLRTKPNAQKEIRIIAKKMIDLVQPTFPIKETIKMIRSIKAKRKEDIWS